MFQLKRLIKVFFVNQGASKAQRTPLTLHDYLSPHERPKHSWKLYIILILLIPTIYYLFYFTSNPKPKIKLQISHTDVITAIYRTTTSTESAKELFEEELPPILPWMHKLRPMKREKTVVNETEHTHIVQQIINDPEAYFALLRGNYKDNVIINTPNADGLKTCIVTYEGNVTITRNILPHWNNFPMVQAGGYHRPPDCRAKDKVAILVPHRNRTSSLNLFLYNIHPFLMKQKLEYRIFVIEQAGKDPFNKGRLFNAGFREIQKIGDWPCIVFHDEHLLPTNDRISYTCPLIPRHMCASIVELESKNFSTAFGGVTSMTVWHYRKVNGYSNLYWDVGGEDDNMFQRLKKSGLGIRRYRKDIARYTSLTQTPHIMGRKRYQFHGNTTSYRDDGLSSLEYNVVSYALQNLYTLIVVDVNISKEKAVIVLND